MAFKSYKEQAISGPVVFIPPPDFGHKGLGHDDPEPVPQSQVPLNTPEARGILPDAPVGATPAVGPAAAVPVVQSPTTGIPPAVAVTPPTVAPGEPFNAVAPASADEGSR